MTMKENEIRQINRMIGVINQIDKIAVDDNLESLDRLQMVYSAVQIVKSAIEELCVDMEEESDHIMGFKIGDRREEE